MSKLVIMTDSCIALSQDAIDKYEIPVLSLSYLVDGVETQGYVKGRPFDYADFYGKLRGKATASTSQATPAKAEEFCRPILEAGHDILYIGLSSGLSGTFFAVKQALENLADEFPSQQLKCVDTLAATLGGGLSVAKACELREEGKSIEEIADWLETNKQRVHHYFTVDDLFHLKRGGRLSAIKALMGSALNVKPLLHVNPEGKLEAIGKAKGRKKSLEAIAEHASLADLSLYGKAYIVHGDALEDAEATKAFVKEKNPDLEVEIHPLDPVIGTHSGPGTIAFLFFANKNR
ncbi:MAG: DegV family protein [Defluviitaleaceae bacterium]|nr:DegV family protein [Defluviitaleaceae bacterium]